jgi:pheganomycin biosynthesis PGM1-like protein
VIPKPPFECDLTVEDELRGFESLKPQLRELWSAVFPGDEAAYTSVVVPSLSFDEQELRKLPGASHHEERFLFLMIRLRNPQARLVYVTSVPVHPLVVEYYLQLLVGTPASHARSRLTLLSAYDRSSRPLSRKILERPRLIQRIRAAVPDPRRAYLTVFNATPLERRLAVLLGIPMNGLDPELAYLGTRSGGRRVIREAGIDNPWGAEDLRSRREVEEALHELHHRRPGARSALLKLNEGFADDGNALFRFPHHPTREAIRGALDRLELPAGTETVPAYLEKLERLGGVVEERLTAPEVRSPSVELRINAHGVPHVSSTHEHPLGPAGQGHGGCRFPADGEYRLRLQAAGLRIAQALAAKGVVSRLCVSFLARREGPEGAWDLKALGVKLRMGSTTAPTLALRFLTGGALDLDTGLFRTPLGRLKYYQASDRLSSPAYAGLSPEDLIEILTVNKLAFDPASETGVLFHMIGAVSEFGVVGLIAVGDGPEQAEALYGRTVAILDHETRYGREGGKP